MADQEDRQRESRRILDRTNAESEGAMGGLRQSLEDHLAGRDADQADPIEIWGTRIGRVLGVVVVVALIWWLATQLATP